MPLWGGPCPQAPGTAALAHWRVCLSVPVPAYLEGALTGLFLQGTGPEDREDGTWSLLCRVQSPRESGLCCGCCLCSGTTCRRGGRYGHRAGRAALQRAPKDPQGEGLGEGEEAPGLELLDECITKWPRLSSAQEVEGRSTGCAALCCCRASPWPSRASGFRLLLVGERGAGREGIRKEHGVLWSEGKQGSLVSQAACLTRPFPHAPGIS